MRCQKSTSCSPWKARIKRCMMGRRRCAHSVGSSPKVSSLSSRDRMSSQSAFVPRMVTDGMPHRKKNSYLKYLHIRWRKDVFVNDERETHAFKVAIMRTDETTVSLRVVVENAGKIHSLSVGSTTWKMSMHSRNRGRAELTFLSISLVIKWAMCPKLTV